MKEQLEACNTIGDAIDLFKTWNKSQLEDFVNALEKANQYIELTMRDRFMLTAAKHRLELYRR